MYDRNRVEFIVKLLHPSLYCYPTNIHSLRISDSWEYKVGLFKGIKKKSESHIGKEETEKYNL